MCNFAYLIVFVMEKELFKKIGRIDTDKPFVVSVEDSVEGDMEFSFKLIYNEFNGSYTRYRVINDHQAEVIISNVRDKGVRSANPIELGTYLGKYELFASFVVFNENNSWGIEVVFTIKDKKA